MKETWHRITAAAVCLIMGGMTGCGAMGTEIFHTDETDRIEEAAKVPETEITDICLDLYQIADKEDQISDLDTTRRIIQRFGEYGYSAVDSFNQVDMTRAEQVIQFCAQVDAGAEGEITITEVSAASDTGGFVVYDLHTEDGLVDVMRTYYEYGNEAMQKRAAGSYQAKYWSYTDEGYLMFSGVWFSEERYVLSMSGAEEYVAFRVQSLDETYREMNRRYLLPVGYERNNLFLTDWSEDDFGELNFYDVFDLCYPKINGRASPYVADGNPEIRTVYQIPAGEFEQVIQSFFRIDRDTLRAKCDYDATSACYAYSPRGFYEAEFPEYPYSEVTDATRHDDGTITLTVNVVFPYGGDSCVYTHEVTVRPLENGGVQYVSNRVIPSEKNGEPVWHIPRLTQEEWEERYGGVELPGGIPL